ncbi:monocarboxylate transporter 10-like [Octopus sinensis]|uniref:Monocarboxylate transporter 10-like n=1 Tax=Octopus sinensis TaxID=2607531 RepID=A0A7E6ETI7_9MOLL|nr:monocarboxylate transporter 10-like [Octopus sinensis]
MEHQHHEGNTSERQTNYSDNLTTFNEINTNSSERQDTSSEKKITLSEIQASFCEIQTNSSETAQSPRWLKWFILVISYIINVIVTGIVFSFGVLYVRLLDEFKQGKARTAAVGSISIGLLFGVGPVAGLLVKRLHSRPVAIFGSVISFIGLLTSSYANTLLQLYVLYSILAGIGFGCLNLTAILCVTEHFQEKQGLACAISSSGCGVGNIIFPIIISELIASVGWRPSMQFLSGIQLVTGLCSLLMFPKRNKFFPCCQFRKKSTKRISNSFNVNIYPNISAVLKDLWMDGLIDMKSSFHSKTKRGSSVNYIQFHSSSTNVIKDSGDFQTGTKRHMCTDEQHSSTQSNSISTVDRYSLEYYQSFCANAMKGNHLVEKPSKNGEQSFTGKIHRCWNCIKNCLRDVNIFKNTKYLVLFCSCLLSATGAGVPAIIILDYAESFGTTTKKAAILVSVIGITGFVGRLLAGAASCYSKLNILMLYTVAMLLSGVSTLLIPLLQHFWFCMLFSAFFGLFYGITAGLDPSILAYIAGKDNIAVSFGFFTLALGVGSTASASLAGLLRDLTGHYRGSFYLAGVFLCTSALCVLPLAILSRQRQRELKDVPPCSCIILTGYHVIH